MDDIVKFQMPDGTEVSNDPRWAGEQMAEAQRKVLDSVPNSGNVGIDDDQMRAQLGQGVDPLQSGQADIDGQVFDPTGGLSVTGRLITRGAAQEAEDKGYDQLSPKHTSDATDTNDKVLEVQALQQEQREAYAKAQAQLVEKDQEAGDPETPLTEWTVPQLKAEVARRNVDRAEEDQLSLTGLKKKSEVVALLENDTYESPADEADGDQEEIEDDEEQDSSES